MGDGMGEGRGPAERSAFEGAVAVVTGGGSGIGRGIAASLAARGVRVLATDLLEERAVETAALLTAAGGVAAGLRIHLARHGVGVSCLVPAGVATNIVELRPVTTPDLAMTDAATVGELVADAIAANRFLVLTDPQAQTLLEQKYADVDAYLDARIRALSES